MKKVKLTVVNFLNDKHGWFVNTVFASSGFLGTFFLTRNYQLSQKSYQDFSSGDLKTGARRAFWLLKTMINFKLIFDDDEFDFTQGLPLDTLNDLEARLEKKLTKVEPLTEKATIIQSDLIYVWAAILESAPERYAEIRPKYEACANDIIKRKQSPNYVYPESKKSKLPKAPLNSEIAREALKDFQYEMNKLGYEWFLVSGTFLGMIREKDFLKHDYDLDFGVFGDEIGIEEIVELLISSEKFLIRRIDYQYRFKFEEDQMTLLSKKMACIKLTHHSGLLIDLFIHYHEGDYIWHGSNLHQWDNVQFELVDYDFVGSKVKGAKDYNWYLTENYGDWRTPVTEFHISSGTPNLSLVSNFRSLSLCLRRIQFASNKAELSNQMDLLRKKNLLNKDKYFSVLNIGNYK